MALGCSFSNAHVCDSSSCSQIFRYVGNPEKEDDYKQQAGFWSGIFAVLGIGALLVITLQVSLQTHACKLLMEFLQQFENLGLGLFLVLSVFESLTSHADLPDVKQQWCSS